MSQPTPDTQVEVVAYMPSSGSFAFVLLPDSEQPVMVFVPTMTVLPTEPYAVDSAVSKYGYVTPDQKTFLPLGELGKFLESK